MAAKEEKYWLKYVSSPTVLVLGNNEPYYFLIPKSTMKKKQLTIEDFSPSLFWDVDKTTLDFEKNAIHVIEKTLSRGSWEDFKTALNYYGWDRTAALIKKIRYLDKQTTQFVSVYFQIPLTELRCYIWRQSTPSHWDY